MPWPMLKPSFSINRLAPSSIQARMPSFSAMSLLNEIAVHLFRGKPPREVQHDHLAGKTVGLIGDHRRAIHGKYKLHLALEGDALAEFLVAFQGVAGDGHFEHSVPARAVVSTSAAILTIFPFR
jgi:hypothetical protein